MKVETLLVEAVLVDSKFHMINNIICDVKIFKNKRLTNYEGEI